MQQLEGCVSAKSAYKFTELVSFHLMLEHKLIHGLWTIDHCAEVALLDQQSSDTLCCLQCSLDRFWSLKADSSKSLKPASIASESLRCKRGLQKGVKHIFTWLCRSEGTRTLCASKWLSNPTSTSFALS
jgi:hypothetical protein